MVVSNCHHGLSTHLCVTSYDVYLRGCRVHILTFIVLLFIPLRYIHIYLQMMTDMNDLKRTVALTPGSSPLSLSLVNQVLDSKTCYCFVNGGPRESLLKSELFSNSSIRLRLWTLDVRRRIWLCIIHRPP